jgi:hypothetical protein
VTQTPKITAEEIDEQTAEQLKAAQDLREAAVRLSKDISFLDDDTFEAKYGASKFEVELYTKAVEALHMSGRVSSLVPVCAWFDALLTKA